MERSLLSQELNTGTGQHTYPSLLSHILHQLIPRSLYGFLHGLFTSSLLLYYCGLDGFLFGKENRVSAARHTCTTYVSEGPLQQVQLALLQVRLYRGIAPYNSFWELLEALGGKKQISHFLKDVVRLTEATWLLCSLFLLLSLHQTASLSSVSTQDFKLNAQSSKNIPQSSGFTHAELCHNSHQMWSGQLPYP